MQRVYLDYMAWVDLAKAALGRPRRQQHADALEIARYGVRHGLVEFPLSSIHYMEVLQQRSPRKREDVGRVMVELSEMRTMAGPPDLQDEEIDRALQSRFGRPRSIAHKPVWGHGMGHAFGVEPYRFVAPAELEVDAETRLIIEGRFTEVVERAMLAGPSEEFGLGEVPGIDRARALADKHASEEAQIGDLVRSLGYTGEKLREAWIARGLSEANEDITRRLLHAGIHPDDWLSLGKQGLTEFFLDIPVLSTYWELRFLRHQNPALSWTGNDLRDIAFLCVAVVHCDIVVTERNWRGLLARTDRGSRYGTTIESDVGAIAPLLARVA